MNKNVNLDDISEQVLKIIKSFDLTPVSFGVVITLKSDEFVRLALNYPDAVQAGLLLKTVSGSDGIQWFVQILQQHHLEINSGE